MNKKIKIHVFDNFADADNFQQSKNLQLTPEELISACYKLSVATWNMYQNECADTKLKDPSTISYNNIKDDR